MINLKTKEQIETLKIGGQKLAKILQAVAKETVAGVSTEYLNDLTHKLMLEEGGKPAFLNYTPEGAARPYPASLCISVNHEIVHGIPNEDPIILKDGDVVTLDAGLIYEDLITDHAITLTIGEVPKEVSKLVAVTKEALMAGIKQAKVGGHIGDIGEVISDIAEKHGFAVMEGLSGHGVGFKVHEDPYVPNYGRKGTGEKIEEGLVIAIEPMFSLGSDEIKIEDDGYTYSTADGAISVQFEHTIAVTADGPVVLTKA